jgi:hypothetical protein
MLVCVLLVNHLKLNYLKKLNIILNHYNILIVQCINMTLQIIGFLILSLSIGYVLHQLVTTDIEDNYSNDSF